MQTGNRKPLFICIFTENKTIKYKNLYLKKNLSTKFLFSFISVKCTQFNVNNNVLGLILIIKAILNNFYKYCLYNIMVLLIT